MGIGIGIRGRKDVLGGCGIDWNWNWMWNWIR